MSKLKAPRVKKKEPVRTVLLRRKDNTEVKIFVPSTATLRKYGLTPEEWIAILRRQNGKCPICRKTPQTGRFNTDHDHVKKWKKMPANVRKTHVRGLLCHFCNHYYLARCITVQKAKNVVTYLEAHEQRVRQ